MQEEAEEELLLHRGLDESLHGAAEAEGRRIWQEVVEEGPCEKEDWAQEEQTRVEAEEEQFAAAKEYLQPF